MEREASDADIEFVVTAIARTRKYGGIDPSIVRRIAREVGKKCAGKRAEVVKLTKRNLHQIHGAYVQTPVPYARLLRRLKKVEHWKRNELEIWVQSALKFHASTAERADFFVEFYRDIRPYIGTPRSVLDLGCGLNPLAMPWMELGSECAYFAFDIDRDMLHFVAECVGIIGHEVVTGVLDLASETPTKSADVAFLLKMLPCLDRQAPARGVEVVSAIDAAVVVVSFPTRSLGGRQRGMRHNYGESFEQHVASAGWSCTRLDFSKELVFVVTKH